MSDPKDTSPHPDNDPTHEPMSQWFAYAHLPPALQAASKPFGDLADMLVRTLPRNPERTAALRSLLQAKDSAVRALIYKDPPKP